MENQISHQITNTLQIYSTKSAIMCSGMCMTNRGCCTASFDTLTKTCTMDIECNPSTVSNNDSVLVRRTITVVGKNFNYCVPTFSCKF